MIGVMIHIGALCNSGTALSAPRCLSHVHTDAPRTHSPTVGSAFGVFYDF